MDDSLKKCKRPCPKCLYHSDSVHINRKWSKWTSCIGRWQFVRRRISDEINTKGCSYNNMPFAEKQLYKIVFPLHLARLPSNLSVSSWSRSETWNKQRNDVSWKTKAYGQNWAREEKAWSEFWRSCLRCSWTHAFTPFYRWRGKQRTLEEAFFEIEDSEMSCVKD